MDVAAALWSAGRGGWPLPLLQTAPYGWPLPPPDAFGVGGPCSFSPAVACAPPPAPWGGCGSERPSCPGCPPGCAAPAAPRDYLQEMAALAAAAAVVGLPIPAPPPLVTLPPQMAFMPVAEAGGRGSREGDADAAHMEGEDSDCEGSTDGSEEGRAAGATAPCLPHSRSAVAAAAKAAVEEAAAAAALAARSLAGSQGQCGLGGSGSTVPHTMHAADQLLGGVEYEDPVPVSDLFGPSDSWLQATPGMLARPQRDSVQHGAAARFEALPPSARPVPAQWAEPRPPAPAPALRPPAPVHAPSRTAARPAPSSITQLLQSIPETSWGPAFSLGASFPHDQPPLPPLLLRAAQQAVPLAPSGLTAAVGLNQALAALDGACMSEGPFSLMVPPEAVLLEGGPAAEGGDRACVDEAATADVAVALEALGCNAPRGALRQARERERELMPPPPPRQMSARQLAPVELSREQLAAAVLAATEAGRAAPGSDERMADCRLAAAAPAAAGTAPAAGHTSTQMHQVDGAADSPSDSPMPRWRTRSRKRRSEASAGAPPAAEFGSLFECGGAGDNSVDGEAEPHSAPMASAAAAAAAVGGGGFNRTWSGLFVGSAAQQASNSNGVPQTEQQQQPQAANPTRQPRGLARLLRHPTGPVAGVAALQGLAGDASNGHQPPHLMKTSHFRGVSWCKRRSLWEAAISINGKRERLGFYRAEDDAARAYDMLACWRNRQLAREHAERMAHGSAPRSRRRRGGGGTSRRARQASKEDDEETESEAEGVRRPAKRRLMSQQLPLNLPEDAPDDSAPILSGSLEDVLECVREAAKQRLKEEPEHSQPSQPATQQPAQKRPRLASYGSESGDGPAPTGPSMLAYASLLGAATGNAAAAAQAAAAAAQAFAGALDPNVDPGMLAAAAAHEAAEAGATIEDAAAAAGAAAAVALHPVPLVKSSKYQGVCLCGSNGRWQAQVTYKRKRHYLGMHGSEESAAKAYDQGAIALLGTNAQTNFPLDCYSVQALMWEGIQAVAARLKARGKAEAAAAERPRNSRRRAGAAVEDGQEEGKAMEE